MAIGLACCMEKGRAKALN